ncbi:hypothetical protein GPECTOR_50g608 [Gonium pectorale]|uniref:Ion transport domain-containing protein n=1 Tax=Gonium pectorale TaxID=33097 RepID=A0A150G7J8_GONPE|nr:hypothetical protein GPECTOR_50g608 [Gonium pectorale]|eukprot:KXZ45814.1 hypothetical protein GPECTOR_50g608 [Gonium pectorale]
MRRPLSMCLYLSVQTAIDSGVGAKNTHYSLLADRYHALAIDLVGRLEVLERMSVVERETAKLPLLEDVLAPPDLGNPAIGNSSVTSMALKMHDLQYFSTFSVQSLMNRRWTGKEYGQVALEEMPWEEISQTNHDWLVKICEEAGFSGPLFFYDSPRGRWAMASLALVAFIVLHHFLLIQPYDTPLGWQHYLFTFYVLSYVIDQVRVIVVHDLKAYLADTWHILDIVLNTVLLLVVVLRGCIAANWIEPSDSNLKTEVEEVGDLSLPSLALLH